jgi:DNA-binding beta-propeller fold protein YncE
VGQLEIEPAETERGTEVSPPAIDSERQSEFPTVPVSGQVGNQGGDQAATAIEPAGAQESDPAERIDSSDEQTSQPDNADAAENPNDGAAENPAGIDERGVQLLPNPFPRKIAMPDFPKDMDWLNTGGPLRLRDLKGKFVILDFWTYCCINCIHILPELKKLEKAYPNELAVIGVHSAKFEAEKGTKNIEEAILRYEIEHPVVNDHEHQIWNMIGIRSWPTVMLIDPQGNAVWYKSGEITFEELDEVLKVGVPYYRQEGLLDETPIRFELLANRQEPTPLRFPGKVLADPSGKRLFITDSNHNRIVVTTLDGKLMTTIGSGAQGDADGNFSSATFDHPQGLALHKELLYVADTENHTIRKIDLKQKQVTTIAGQGFQGRNPWLGLDRNATFADVPDRFIAKPLDAALNSPWALWVHADDLYIAMAGPHQIWKMTLDESEIGPYAGNGQEDIVDGPLLPRSPYQQGFSSFAQPSGLTSDGKQLFVADSEGSSIRAVPFSSDGLVSTIVGSADLPHSRLFTFGDQDGKREDVLLQHALGVEYFEGRIFVADTYNNKIKVVDAKTGETTTIAGTGEAGLSDSPALFDEPAGIAYAGGLLYVADTNNHVIRTIEVATGKVATWSIEGLEQPQISQPAAAPDFARSPQVKIDSTVVKAADGRVQMSVALAFPEGWKLNKLAPLECWLADVQEGGPVKADVSGRGAIEVDGVNLTLSVPVNGEGKDAVRVSLIYYYCQEGGEGVCKMGSVVWNVPFEVVADAKRDFLLLSFQVAVDGP